MLTQGGVVKVLDFGMGRIVDDPDEARLTSTGVSVGTARYMAPEQFEARQVTQAADLYALGCVLYEILVGVPPFTSESPFELAAKHTREEPATHHRHPEWDSHGTHPACRPASRQRPGSPPRRRRGRTRRAASLGRTGR